MKNNNTFHRLPILDGLELFHAKNHTLDFPFHSHETFNISIILDQVYTTKLTDKYLQAPKGSIIITNPNEVHATICENKIGNSFFTFYIAPEILKSLNDNEDLFFEDKVIYDPFLFQELYYLSENYKSVQVDFEKKLMLILKQLVRKYSKERRLEKDYKIFKGYIEENAFEKFSLEQTAKTFGLDKFKFLRLFKEETGLTPNNYIILKRIEKCKTLLQSNDDLLEIAVKTGFYDATHLCKHFKRLTGITPLAYKNA